MAENKNENQQSQEMLDKTYVVEGFDPSKLQNADVNLSQYWDDSSEANYNNPSLWGGENTKYTGENTLGSQVAYNPNATVEGLDPNYLYWQEAQMQNSKEANYIAKRNDEIASALYNAWKTSIQDVNDFLDSQRGFYNSVWNERANTVTAVWKRIGQIAKQNEKSDEPQADPNKTPDEWNNDALNNMQSDLNKSTAGELYGKVTADQDTHIKTLEDENSVYKADAAARISTFKELQSTDSQAIAAAIASGTSSYSDQAMRDLMQYDPAKYEEVQMHVKQIRWQMTINWITSGNYDFTSEITSKSNNLENSKTAMAEGVAVSDEEIWAILRDLDTTLSSNQAANTAEGTMANITADINKLNTRLKNLSKEANSIFKWDVPQYIVNAYVANRTAEIQDKIKELQYNYDAAYSRYQTELNNTWKEKEFDLKLKQYNLDVQQQEFNQWYQKQSLLKSSIIEDDSWQRWQMNINEKWEIYYTQISSITQYEGSWMKWAWLKNNNPWNIKDTQFWNVIGTWANGFAQFATPEDWFDALVEKIKFNQTNPKSRYYGKTIAEYFRTYAPATDGNDPEAYAREVANRLWVSTSTPISELDPIKFAAAIAKHDSGYDYSTYWKYRKSDKASNSSMDNIEIPDSVYVVEDNVNKVSRRVDPNSEEGKALREKYIQSQAMSDLDLNNTSYETGAMSEYWTPLAYQQRIYNLIPATLKNSDTELKNVYTVAKTLYDAGYTADEAALTFYWLDVNKDKTGLLQVLVDKARSSGNDLPDAFYGSLGGYLENWNSWGAITLVENSVIPDDRKKDIQKYTSILAKLENLQNAVNEWEAVLWPVAWTTIGKINKLISDPKYQTAASAIDNAYSALRNELMGSNMTEVELKAYENLFPNTKDPVKNINIKVQQSIIAALNDINAIRKTYGLPEVNLQSALHPEYRAWLYRNTDDWSDIAE